MPELDLVLLGNYIRDARKKCGLTQKELAAQTGLSIKTVHDIEKGRKNPTYETLAHLVSRLGISPDTLFPPKVMFPSDEVQQILDNFQICNSKSQDILLKTMRFLAEQLRENQAESD